ncbi:MAG: LuxR family transcriptional regulator [Rhizobiales bacterium]|nr:LuxR family transcriptional regulator [Hyphomicrobiales bacterium]MBI3672793.1 LuxR family transcriptional regulator [Hyphomicrobiales bacterium]
MAFHFDVFAESWRPFASSNESADYLRQSCSRYGVLNLSYWYLGAAGQRPGRLTWLSTYDEDYMALYMRDFSPHGDPAFDVCFRQTLPLDWSEVRDADDTTRRIHHLAEEFGVGRQGLTFSIADSDSSTAMFSVNFDCDDRQWTSLRSRIANGFHLYAYYFHERMRELVMSNPATVPLDLSRREREVLQWAAAGKTAWETANVLGLSERAVRLYTENAMNKLDARTKTQAVAIAVKNAIIN